MGNKLTEKNLWLLSSVITDQTKLLLFCFHYAGGNASMYKDWYKYMPAQVAVCPIQLPGRSNRFKEPCYTDLSALIPALAEAIRPYLDRPFTFFGHSMGALISFELARYIRKVYNLLPIHMFVAGYHAPQLPDPGAPIFHLPDNEFLSELEKMNGTPKELLEHKELMEIMLPLFRADFKLADTYTYRQDEPLACSITAFGGSQDPEVSIKHIQAWKEQTVSSFQVHILEGDHFFIHSQQDKILSIVSGFLSDLLKN
ncbi:thioesterase II family protein [Paenactinomyces guangxiensis]|uniref:Thioesterase n=1 Tax=Paenactinomyces guangxiensis TaxID=1490290 RepID=A0A7W1WR95_9BACL|nr:thioesterase II family protein [Paenactinomyces guangxiensis]MBA4494618.1 thioesterase [Paenactinomyces guangxiensis]MBH8591619.1 thioesterase [Paenactinomyces guangxiensis]